MYQDEYDYDVDLDANWAGGVGFAMDESSKKWKGTRKACFWPIYSESLAVTETEVHIKRNDCPALPRECRPYRAWSVAPVEKISAFRMVKRSFTAAKMFVLIVCSLIVGFVCGGVISAATQGIFDDSSAVLPEFDNEFFILSAVIFAVTFCILWQLLVLCTPLSLDISVDGTSSWFGIDLKAGSVEANEIKEAIELAQSNMAEEA